MVHPAPNFKPASTVYGPKRKTRQATREAIAIGKSPGLAGLLRTSHPNKQAAAGSTDSDITNYRDSNDSSDDSPTKPPLPTLPTGPSPMDGVHFNTHQSRYEHDNDSPLPNSHVTSARQKTKGKKKLVKGKKNKSTTTTSEDASDSISSEDSDDGAIDTIWVARPPATTLGKRKNLPEELVDPAQRPRKRRGKGKGKEIDIDALVDATAAAFNHDEDTAAAGPSTAPLRPAKRKGTAMKNAVFVTPRDKGITKVAKSQLSSADKMELCTPDTSPGGKEAAEEIKKLKNQIVELTLRDKQSTEKILEAKRNFEFLSDLVEELTNRDGEWERMKTETTNRIRPLASLLKLINDYFHIDPAKDVDYIYWKNMLDD